MIILRAATLCELNARLEENLASTCSALEKHTGSEKIGPDFS
jgi:hypothetical protein